MEGVESIYLIAGGTRGDCQPLVIVGNELKSKGYRIVLCCPPENASWADRFGFEHVPLYSVKSVVQGSEAMHDAAEKGDVQTVLNVFGTQDAQHAEEDTKRIKEKLASDTSKIVAFLASSTLMTLPIVIRRYLNDESIFVARVLFTPTWPTQDYPPLLIDSKQPLSWQLLPNPDGSTPGPFANLFVPPVCAYPILYRSLLQRGNQFRIQSLAHYEKLYGVEHFEDFNMEKLMKVALAEDNFKNSEVYCPFSTLCMGTDYTPVQRKSVHGFIFNVQEGDDDMSSFPPELESFLSSGDAPIYFGWGSMSRKNNSNLVRAAIGTCQNLKKRGILLRGWAQLSIDMLDLEEDKELVEYAKENIIFVDKVDHIQLFPRCCCTVTHGGMGTFGAMLRSGKPGVITPCWWDQNFTGDRIEILGAGRRGPHFSKLNADNLTPVIQLVLTDDDIEARCAKIRDFVIAEKGHITMAENIHQKIQEIRSSP